MTDSPSDPVLPARSTVVVDALGSAVAIHVDDADADAVREAWSGALSRTADADRRADAASPLDLATLSTVTTLEAIGARRGELLMFHACGLARPDGAVAAFVAASGTGKTTLARTLGRVLGYVSDETIAVDADGTVLPYRKPLSIIEDAGAPKVQRSPGSIGLMELPDAPLRLAALVILERDEGFDAPDAELEPVDLLDALPALVPQMSYLGALPDGLGALAALHARIGGVVRIRYREAAQVLDRIDAAFEPAGTPAVRTLHHGITRQSTHHGGGGWSRTDDVQWLDDGARVATFDRTTVRILDGVGAAVWQSLAEAATLETVTARVVALLGPAPTGDSPALVLQALQTLSAAGLVVEP